MKNELLIFFYFNIFLFLLNLKMIIFNFYHYFETNNLQFPLERRLNKLLFEGLLLRLIVKPTGLS